MCKAVLGSAIDSPAADRGQTSAVQRQMNEAAITGFQDRGQGLSAVPPLGVAEGALTSHQPLPGDGQFFTQMAMLFSHGQGVTTPPCSQQLSALGHRTEEP